MIYHAIRKCLLCYKAIVEITHRREFSGFEYTSVHWKHHTRWLHRVVGDVDASRIEWNRESGLINRTCTLHFIDPRYIYYGDRYLLLAVVSAGA